ncbi:optineurin isoform X1 [Anguilla rostrata]|uniref:optineurin isoform X1 n=1 Tax=Anguilla rostrata TaxID=7938 RepID=UPI0030D5B23D
MASNPPVENGAIQGPSRHKPGDGDCLVPKTGPLEDTIQQMKVLIKENRELKEALKQTSTTMKERFEGLSAWKDKQKEERDFLEGKLVEAKERVTVLTRRNEEQRKRIQALEGAEGAEEGETSHWALELEALKAQIVRLQAEKSDLVAMNSELQLKMRPSSPDDSFIEIRIAKGEVNVTKDLEDGQKDSEMSDSTMCRQKSEELTVSQLLQSLRKETQRVEKLELELLAARERISELELEAVKQVEVETQTTLAGGKMEEPATVSQPQGEPPQEAPRKESDAELGNLKGQMTKLFKELQQAQTKLDDAEDMKKSLHDRCRDMEQELTMLRAQLVEKQQVQTENRRLRLQLESVQTSIQVEQKNAEDERSNVAQVKDEYIKLLEDYNALKQEMKTKEVSQVQAENEKLKLQVESMQTTVKIEQKRAEDERNNMARVKDEYTKLYEDYNALKQDMKKKEPPVSKEEIMELQARLDSAEKALAAKQQKIDEMKQEIFKKEQELETISVFQAQAEVYSSDFYAERAAREKIHEEKERLAAQLEFVKKQNSQLQDEMESMGRQSLNEMQRRHEVARGAGPRGGGQQHGRLEGRGAMSRDWEQQQDIPEHACPKCNEILPDLDTLQIHIMDCII